MRISDWSSDVCSSDLPYVPGRARGRLSLWACGRAAHDKRAQPILLQFPFGGPGPFDGHWSIGRRQDGRSEEHTSELQSLMRISYAVFCLKKQTLLYTLQSIYNIAILHDVLV